MASFTNWTFKVYAKMSTGDTITVTNVDGNASNQNMYDAITALASFKEGVIEKIYLQDVAEIVNQ